jgi:hypothetical protein
MTECILATSSVLSVISVVRNAITHHEIHKKV